LQRIRLAFVKFSGLAAGGTERWLQMIAASLPRDQFDVDYFYCDAAPYIGSDYKHADTDPDRLHYMQQQGVNLTKFSVLAKDVNTPTHEWVGTDFWQKFDSSCYDFVQTGKAGPAEYPYYMMTIPVVECVTLSAGIDSSPNIAWSFLLSQWQRREWIAEGGNWRKSSIVPVPVVAPSSANNLRNELDIPDAALVGGFHQRVDDGIFSPFPLEAFAKVSTPDQHFMVMGGSQLYQEQAANLGLTNVHFLSQTGNADRISAFLNSLDVFVHGRRDGETFGTALAEAMIHGVPCLSHPSLVGTNNAQTETIGPGGLFANGRDEYAAMLQTLFQDETLRKKLATKAKDHAAQYYSLTACVREVADTYRQLAGVKALNDGTSIRPAYEYSPRGYLQAVAPEAPPGISNDVPAAGALEQYEVDLVRQLAPQMKIVVDIGAGSGPFCLVAAKEIDPRGKVIVYETRPECLADLREAVYLNNWEDRLDIRPIALAARSSRVRLQASLTGTGKDGDLDDDWSTPSGLMAEDTLDHQFEQMHLDRLDFLRINPQCSALKVLRGAEDVIGQYSPALLIGITDALSEPHQTNRGDLPAIPWLQDHGYVVYKCTKDLRLIKVGLNLPTKTFGSYFCFKIGLHKHWETQLRTWAFKYRIWRLFQHSHAREMTPSSRRPNGVGKALRNPKAAIASVVARFGLIYGNAASRGRRSDPNTSRLTPKRQR
jgi:FkbM family methyltransferase